MFDLGGRKVRLYFPKIIISVIFLSNCSSLLNILFRNIYCNLYIHINISFAFGESLLVKNNTIFCILWICLLAMCIISYCVFSYMSGINKSTSQIELLLKGKISEYRINNSYVLPCVTNQEVYLLMYYSSTIRDLSDFWFTLVYPMLHPQTNKKKN